jgi:2-oxoglutarate dehydrogenase complex dehydrogenase (E1) component-like enzyme
LTSGGFREVLADASPSSRSVLARGFLLRQDLLRPAGRARGAKANHVALVRVEQLYPFAEGDANDALLRYPLTAEVVWAQEEPRNMGPWRFMRGTIAAAAGARRGRELALCGTSGKRQPGDWVGDGAIRRSRRLSPDEAMSERPVMESRRVQASFARP